MVTAVTVTVPNPVFTIDTTTTNLTDQMLLLCANACYAGSTSYSTVPFYTLGTPRSVTLAYTEERAHPRPVIYADVSIPVGGATPTQYTLAATVDGTTVTFLNGDTKLYFSGSGSKVRLAGQFDGASYSTGVHTLVVTATATFSGGTVVTHTYTRLLAIVNEAHSPLGRGWTVVGVQHLYVSGSSYLITDGTGSAVYFSGLGVQAADYSTLTYNAGGAYYVRAYPDSSHVYFTAAGQDTAFVDRLGFRTRHTYSGTRLQSITEPERYLRGNVGMYLTLSYGTYGLSAISEVGGTGGRIMSVTVASDSTLRTITDPDGIATNYTYDASGRLATLTDRRGGVTTYVYDTHSWKLSEVDLPQIAADAGGGSTVNVVPKIKYIPWMTLGVPTSATSSGSPATPTVLSSIYATITDPIGRVTTMTTDRWGQPLVITDPALRVTTITRSGRLPVKIAYPSSGIDTMAYVTGTSLLSYQKLAGDSAINYHYGAKNQVDSVWGPESTAEYRFLQSATGRVDSIRYAGSNAWKSRYTYDSYNRVTSVTDPSAHTTTYHYDPVYGNVDSVGRPGNLYTVARFDAFGRDSALRSAGTSLWAHVLYDTLNRTKKSWHSGLPVGAWNDTAFTSYDSLYPTRMVAPGGSIYKRTQNALGWVTARYDAYDTTKAIMYRYDTAGRVTSITNRRNQRVDFKYDSLDRLITRTASGAVTDSLGYSTDGRVMGATRLNAGVAISRDSVYKSVNGQTDSIVHRFGGHRYAIRYTYAYPNGGLRRTVTIANDAGISFSQETDAVHDTVAKDDSVTLTGGHGAGTTIIKKNSDGLPYVIRAVAAGVEWDPTYTAQHQTSWLFMGQSALADSLSLAVKFDSLGRAISDERTIVNDLLGHARLSRKFLSDSLGRLLKVAVFADSQCVQVSDSTAFGIAYNCTSSVFKTTQDSTQYDNAENSLFPGATYTSRGNRLLTGKSGMSYTYDSDGNMVTRTHNGVVDSLFWSPTGQLDSIASGGSAGVRQRYDYNSAGQLVRRQTKIGAGLYGIDRYFLWDENRMIAELSGTGTRIAQYVYLGMDNPFAIITDSAGTSLVRYYYQDPTGTFTGVMRDSTSLKQYTQYSVWGNQLARSINTLADTNRLGWKGLIYMGDSTRLYYMRNRWYDPAMGRFISEDPAGISGGHNLYVFADNDPVNNMDPYGLFSWRSVFGEIGSVVGDFIGETIGATLRKAIFKKHKKNSSGASSSPSDPVGSLPSIATGPSSFGSIDPRLPDYLNLNVNIAIPNPWTLTLVGWSGSASLDRYGDIYWSAAGGGVGKSATIASFSLTANWVNQLRKPSQGQLDGFLSGNGFSGAVGFWGGAVESWTPGSGWTTGVGIVTPQAGVSYNYSWHAVHTRMGW